jgi:hypothetical protein
VLYRAFVRWMVRRAFRDLSAGRVERHVRRFHPEAELRLRGVAPGADGVYRRREAIADALHEKYAREPAHDYRLRDVWVRGTPADTRIAVSWTDRVQRDDGVRAQVRGMNRIRIRWGRVVEEELYRGGAAPDEGERGPGSRLRG